MTEEYRKIKEYAEQWNIDYDSVRWNLSDAVYWKIQGGDQFLHSSKLQFISQYKEVIKDAAQKYDLPEILVAGVTYCEYGGDPMIFDDGGYLARTINENILKLEDDGSALTRNPDLTSFGNVSIQVRRAWESLGYRESEVSDELKQDIIGSLKDPVQNIYISAKHISDLRDIEYPNLTAEEFTEEEIVIVGTRYNRGPDMSLDKLKEDTDYGARIIRNQEDLKKALEYEK